MITNVLLRFLRITV